MTHSDADVLAMLALGDPDVDDADIGHVATCQECRAELERLTRVTRAARENGPVDFELQDPSPRVWESIRDQLSAAPPAAPQAAVSQLPTRPPARAPRRRWPVLAAAAAVLVILAGMALVVSFRPGGSEVQAQATLSGLPAWSTSNGQATMERESDGTTVLAVELDSPAVHSGSADYREVWLMSSDLTKAISVGLLDGGTGRFTMPPNIAAADYPVIDISQQPLNGDPAHSGDSIVRGTLSATR